MIKEKIYFKYDHTTDSYKVTKTVNTVRHKPGDVLQKKDVEYLVNIPRVDVTIN
jgi:hypothetical protein